MWYMNYLIFIGLAVLFLLIALWKEDNPFWNLVPTFISSVLWLIIGIGQMEIQYPYQLYGSQDVICGICEYTDPLSPYFVYIFFGLFVILQVYVWAMVLYFKPSWYEQDM